MYDMPDKTTSENSRFIPRLGLLREDEVLELERRKLYDSRVQEFSALGRDWVEPVITTPLGTTVSSLDDEGRHVIDEAGHGMDVMGQQIAEVWGLDVE
ncbi:kinesin [Trypanosoma grayi]|uniref:kinesin n=1 Tax=Trypanosoma grayi TaxID=71804 RepID=UPI0004F3F2D1|nr:kinesin [Trypanosoma grayi]KEG08137.1 kinesin [Trypanosoma grayi]